MKMRIENRDGRAEIVLAYYNYSDPKDYFHKVVSGSEMLSQLAGCCKHPIDGKSVVAVVGPFSGNTLDVELEGVDSWRHAIYAMSEGEIHISGQSKNVHGQRFIACSTGDLASYLMTMACEYAKANGLSFDYSFTRSDFFRIEALKKLVPATEEQERDPSIKWVKEGSSKYGRRMVNYELGIWRCLTITEFYGGGVVD